MLRSALIIFLLIIIQAVNCPAQVKIRLFASRNTGSVLFTVSEGEYEINDFRNAPFILAKGEMVLISRSEKRIVLKKVSTAGYFCDSLLIRSAAPESKFALRLNGDDPVRQYYSGDLKCLPDMGNIVLLNLCDPEIYIAGVVRAEGGVNRSPEYFKTQAVIVRTYLYRNIGKHAMDGYNMCDNTHCQVFNGITNDTMIINAAFATKGMVILGPDSTLINSAFHSNCGGETASSGDVWLINEPYLRSIKDPYCLTSRNAVWQKTLTKDRWINYLQNTGYKGNAADTGVLCFSQKSRMKNMKLGSFTVPLRQVRDDLNLRSSFFSVTSAGDSVVLKGRGYGHGVGLCQEGAMVMAQKGFDFRKIISFYYTGVRIADIKDALAPKPD